MEVIQLMLLQSLPFPLELLTLLVAFIVSFYVNFHVFTDYSSKKLAQKEYQATFEFGFQGLVFFVFLQFALHLYLSGYALQGSPQEYYGSMAVLASTLLIADSFLRRAASEKLFPEHS